MSELADDNALPKESAVETLAPVDPATNENVGARADDVVPVRSARGSREQIQTTRLDSRDFRPSWPVAIAALERLSGWSVLALRLGTLALIQQCVRELAEEDAKADIIVRLRALTDALAHMPLET